jgi:hypothetical protein
MLEQRRYERIDYFCPLQLTVLPNGPSVPGNSFDITVAGVGIVAGVLLNRGQTVRVRFHLHNGSSDTVDEEIMGRVAYCKSDEDGNRLGIEFLELIGETAQPVLAHKLDTM